MMSKARMSFQLFACLVVVVGEIYLQRVSGALKTSHRPWRMADHPPIAFAKRAVFVVTCRKSGIQARSENKKPIVICVREMPSTAPAVSYLKLYQPAAS